MRLGLLLLVAISPQCLCSCAVYEYATAKDDESREDLAMAIGMAPVVAITGTRALEGPTEKERGKNLPEYARTIRNRNLGKNNAGDRRLTLLAMEYSYPLRSAMTEKEVVDLLGPPDEKTERNGRIGYIYRIKGLQGGPPEPTLYVNPD